MVRNLFDPTPMQQQPSIAWRLPGTRRPPARREWRAECRPLCGRYTLHRYWHNMGGPTGPDNTTGTGAYHLRVHGQDFTYQVRQLPANRSPIFPPADSHTLVAHRGGLRARMSGSPPRLCSLACRRCTGEPYRAAKAHPSRYAKNMSTFAGQTGTDISPWLSAVFVR
jgi:hypothetical protein